MNRFERQSYMKEIKHVMEWYKLHLKLRLISIIAFLIIGIILTKEAINYGYEVDISHPIIGVIIVGIIISYQIIEYFLLKNFRKMGYILLVVTNVIILFCVVVYVVIGGVISFLGGPIIAMIFLSIGSSVIYLIITNLRYYRIRKRYFKY